MSNDRFKFRVFDIEEKEMDSYYEGLCVYDMHEIMKYGLHAGGGSIDRNIVIMQCTGLKDKNGVLIFEGDIVLMHSGHKLLEADFGVSKYMVQWRDSGACFDMMHEDYLDSERQVGTTFDNGGVFSIEIIGNIHESPELLD